MKKIFCIYLFLICFCLQAFNQSSYTLDSIRTENLKKQLGNAKGTQKTDILNDIAREYQYLGKVDSVYTYATLASKGAKEVGYEYGLASALIKLGVYEVFKTNDFTKAEKFFKDAIAIGEKINKPELLGWAYLGWSEIDIRKNNSKIETWKKALEYFKKGGDEEGEAEVSNWLCSEYSAKGEYEQGFPYCERSVELSGKKRVHNISWGYFLVDFSLMNMSELYTAAGDYETAMEYLRKAQAYSIQNNYEWDMGDLIGTLYVKMKQPDSALSYLKGYETATNVKPFKKILAAEAYLLTKEYKKSLQLFTIAVETNRNKPLNQSLARGLIGLAQAYEGLKNYNTSLKYAKEGFLLAQKRSQWELIMEGNLLLSKLYHHLKNNGLAYSYLNSYVTLKDSVINRQFLWRLNNYKKKAEEEKRTVQINLLNKENQLTAATLKQESFVKKSLIAGLVLLILLGGFIFRTLSLKRKNERLRLQKDLELEKLRGEQKHIQLQRQAVELEMQALRAQMNPHFIFNCLSSINRFIFKNDNKAASDYLTKFSRLIRMVLVQSQKKVIPLEDELEMLRLYLDMERMRFKNGFDYSITTNNTIDAGAIFIPPLLLQPFCENAIWHGLMHKDGQGHLNISIAEENRFLICTITDNGIGREKAATYKSKSAEKEKSLGLKITANRLALLNKEQNAGTSYEIDDMIDEEGNAAGTKVQLKIFYKNAVEEIEQNA